MADQNPKTDGSSIVDCIPQTGYCPNKCQECFYNNGFFRDLDEPLIPTTQDVGDKIVRVNTGHDSNLNKKWVLDVTSVYKKKFYNTSICDFEFPAPVVYTCNGRDTDEFDVAAFRARELNLSNVMAVRFRINTWNLEAADKCVNYFTPQKIPVLLTFMRYKLYEHVKKIADYQYEKHILNTYWSIKETKWREIVDRYKENKLVYICGKNYGNSTCKGCNHCELLYKKILECKKAL